MANTCNPVIAQAKLQSFREKKTQGLVASDIDGGIGPCVNPFTLPYVDLDDKTDLPSKPGLYFVIDGKTLLYIGRSKDLNQRWKGHHRYKQIKAIAQNPQIAFLDCDDEALLWTERDVINRFKPILNDTRMKEGQSMPMDLNQGTDSRGRKQQPKQSPQAKQQPAADVSDDETEVCMIEVEKIVESFCKLPSYNQRITIGTLVALYKKTKRVEFEHCLKLAARVVDGNPQFAASFCKSLMSITTDVQKADTETPIVTPPPEETPITHEPQISSS